MPPDAPRLIVRIEVSRSAKQTCADAAARFGTSQVAVIDRLIGWLANQPATVQAAILGQYPKEIEADVARIILRRMGPVDRSK
jgi:hypothetical protein